MTPVKLMVSLDCEIAEGSVFIGLFSAYGGDLECDFESPLWDRGHCNWGYGRNSNKRLERRFEIPTAQHGRIPQQWYLGNHYLVLEGKGTVELVGRTVLGENSICGDTSLTSKYVQRDFGFMYKKTPDSEVSKCLYVGTSGLLSNFFIFSVDICVQKTTVHCEWTK